MERQAPTTCQICLADCGLLASLREGRVSDVKGDPENPQNRGAICIKGKSSPSILYAPDRILSPLVRSSNRGGEGFKRTGWDEALDRIACNLRGIRDKYGPQALCIYHGRTTRFIDRAFISGFARLFGTPNTTGVWSMCVGPKVIAYRATFGPPLFPSCDFRNAKLILLWGTNPAVSRMHRYFRVFDDIMEAKKRGAMLVVIDPRVHRTARAADMHLPIRPGTDIYLALGLIKLLIEEGGVDEAFVSSYTEGFDALRESVQGLDIAEVARKTGLQKRQILETAEALGKIRPASIDRREGTMHVTNGTQLNRALAILAAITGNVDVAGGLSFNPQVRWNTKLGIEDRVLPKSFWADRFPLAADATGLLAEAILTATPYPIKALICIAGNPLSVFPNTRKVRDALNDLELLVVNDLFMTETARIAHVVVPGVTFYEKGEFETGPFKRGLWVKLTAPLVEPRGQALPEWRFLAMLADAMGYSELAAFRSEDEIMERVFADSGCSHLSPSALRRGRLLRPLEHGSLLAGGFQSPSGKIELHARWLEQKGYPALPSPSDACPTTPQYPYRLVTGGRLDPFYHSQFRNIPRLSRLCPHPEAEISGELARRLAVKDGDTVRVSTPEASMAIRVKVVEGMNPETVAIPHGWEGLDNVNRLVADNRYDPIAGTPAFKAIPCQLQSAPVQPGSSNK